MKDAPEINIPKLDEMAYEQVELTGVPFSTFVADKTLDNQPADYSLVLRGYVRTWLNQVQAEYDRVGLLDRMYERAARSGARLVEREATLNELRRDRLCGSVVRPVPSRALLDAP